MKMVAASRLKKAKLRLDASRNYATGMDNMIRETISNQSSEDFTSNSYPLLTGSGSKETYLLIVISSDRGLCGGLNSSTVKFTKNLFNSLVSQGRQVKLFCVGKKAYEQLKGQYGNHIIGNISGIFSNAIVGYECAVDLGKQIIELYQSSKFDICEVVYSRFKSAIAQEQKITQLIPIQKFVDENANDHFSSKPSFISYEPSKEEILSDLLVKNISIQLFNFLLENSASEQGARMSAMESASNNATKIIKDLTLKYNRTRQANITKELIDIISGANSV